MITPGRVLLIFVSILAIAPFTRGQLSTNVVERSGASVAPRWTAKNRNHHATEWQAVRLIPNAATGRTRAVTNRFVELATGLNVRDTNGQFRAANPAFQITDRGAVANGGAHQVRLAGNINSAGAVLVRKGDVTFQVHPLCLAYYDPADGRSLMLAELTNAIGWLVASNTVV